MLFIIVVIIIIIIYMYIMVLLEHLEQADPFASTTWMKRHPQGAISLWIKSRSSCRATAKKEAPETSPDAFLDEEDRARGVLAMSVHWPTGFPFRKICGARWPPVILQIVLKQSQHLGQEL
jgi:hypothetical protein